MSQEQKYKRDANGMRFQMGGINTVLPPDQMPPNKYPFLQNVRSYRAQRMIGRAVQGDPQQALGSAVHSLRRLNDTTPEGPVSGFALVGGAGAALFLNSTQIATGFSGNPLALVPFRPNSSPQPWMYVGDSSDSVELLVSSFACAGMVKVRSDGLVFKTGVKEPQSAPVIGTETTTVTGNVTVLGTARPWSNVSGLNPSFNYGDNGNGTGSVVISTPVTGAKVVLTATGTAVVNGVSHGPGDAGPIGTQNPGHFVLGGSCAILCGAWTDSSGNVVSGVTAGAVTIGASATLTVPAGATRLQLGIDGIGGNFSGNTGSFAVAFAVTTSAVTTVLSTFGDITAYYWGDSPHSGPVQDYIWKNPDDTAGTGPTRSIVDANGFTSNNSLAFDEPTHGSGATPMQWNVLDSTGTTLSTKAVFQPALESEGYQDFNLCIVGNLFAPAAGTYSIAINVQNTCMWGIGGNATWPGQGTFRGTQSQTMTVVSKLQLLPTVQNNVTTIAVTFPAAGLYPIELDYDYWDKSGRNLNITSPFGTVIPPVTGNAKQDVSYRYVFRSSITGATSNPSPASIPEQVPSISNTILPEFSTDPQVDKVDFYRMDSALDSFTYVGTGPNTNPPTKFTDQLLDTDVAANPLLQFDNFEPFPSIDLPKGGVVNVVGGVVEWVSGDLFNVRWLPGTIINIGGIAYTLYNRPSSTTNLLAIDVEDGTNLTYEIAEPILAAQPMGSMWGDTDNTAFVFACGDPLRPGVLYWCKGNNLDSAPDTNQQDVTSPSEPLINGVIANGIGMVFSAENGWSIYPNFSAALATVTGVQGSAFSLIRASVTRGLYIRPCICTDGSGTFFYRSKDGIEATSGGGKQQSLTDTDLFNLFPHEGTVPQAITLAGFTIYPPDDTQPEAQKLRFATGYLYYDYIGIGTGPCTLVFDVAGGGWVVDVYQHPATIHMLEEGPNANGVLTGCSNGTIRALGSTGSEAATCVVLTPAVNGSDARAQKTVGDIFVRAAVASGQPATVALYANQYAVTLTGFSPTALAGTSLALTPFIIDFVDGDARTVNDIEMALTWPAGYGTYLDLWQPDWTDNPESTQDRPSDWMDMGGEGANFVQGLLLEADTFNVAKLFSIENADDGTFHTPNECPLTLNGQTKVALTFTPPFVGHIGRIISTDGVPWRVWGQRWIALPFPELVVEWQTEMTSLGTDGWQHLREFNIAHVSTADLILTIVFDPGAAPQTIVLTVPNSGGLQAKTKITCPRNKFKLVSFRLSSAEPFRVFENDVECKVGPWGREEPYRNLKVIGGGSAPGAQV